MLRPVANPQVSQRLIFPDRFHYAVELAQFHGPKSGPRIWQGGSFSKFGRVLKHHFGTFLAYFDILSGMSSVILSGTASDIWHIFCQFLKPVF